jgi:large subunit ribosomal protein L17
MRHGIDHRKLGRKPAHRKALLRNLMNALVHAERIETTVSKAKELRPLADRLITLGKAGTLHSRRRVFSLLTDKEATDKLFATLAGRFVGRHGGYTRIVRTGFRVGDGAEMAIIEYLPAEEKKAGGKKKKAGAKKAPAKTPVKKKEEKETSRTGSRKMKPSAPKPTKPRSSRAQTQKTPEGGQG